MIDDDDKLLLSAPIRGFVHETRKPETFIVSFTQQKPYFEKREKFEFVFPTLAGIEGSQTLHINFIPMVSHIWLRIC